MYQVIQNAANSVNYSDIINYYVSKDLSGSPSGFRKILGHEARIDKFLVNNQSIQIKPPIQRKADLYMPKFLTHAIDSHVRDICFVNYKNLTEIIYKLNEACDTDLNTVRYILRFIFYIRSIIRGIKLDIHFFQYKINWIKIEFPILVHGLLNEIKR